MFKCPKLRNNLLVGYTANVGNSLPRQGKKKKKKKPITLLQEKL
jgi:hypothetical protein